MSLITLHLSEQHVRALLHTILHKMESVSEKEDKEHVERVLSNYDLMFDIIERHLNEQLYDESRRTWTNDDGTEESQWEYVIDGQPLITRNKIPYFELDRIREEMGQFLKNII